MVDLAAALRFTLACLGLLRAAGSAGRVDEVLQTANCSGRL